MESQLIREYCEQIQSNKVTHRRKCVQEFANALCKRSFISVVNNSENNLSWEYVINSIFIFLNEEAEQLNKEEQLKKTIFHTHRNVAIELLATIRAGHIDESKVPIVYLLNHILESNGKGLLKHFFEEGFYRLIEFILSKPFYWGQLSEKCWIDILQTLKSQLDKYITGLELTFKWAPLHKLPPLILRSEFPFITDLCKATIHTKRFKCKETALKLILQYLENTSPDCRMSSCDFGENIFDNLRSLYDVSGVNSCKHILNSLFYKQMRIHHCKGGLENTQIAYACSWPEWNKILRVLYSILTHEIDIFCEKWGRLMKLKSGFGSATTENQLDPVLVSLYVDVCQQMFNKDINDVTQVPQLNASISATKRCRTEVGFGLITSRIQECVKWPWIVVLTEFLENYPEIISRGEFCELVQILATLQTEDLDSSEYINNCLAVLLDVEDVVCNGEESVAVNVWNVIWESTLRLIGLNKCPEATHKLLQKLILSNKSFPYADLFKIYLDEIVSLTKYSINSLDIACLKFPLSGSENTRKKLLNWILSDKSNTIQNYEIYSENIVALVLIKIVLKQWPENQASIPKGDTGLNLDELETIYDLNSFNKALILHTKVTESFEDLEEDVYLVNRPILKELYSLLLTFTSCLEGYSIKSIINIALLLLNVLSYMINYKILHEEELEDDKLLARLNGVLYKLSNQFRDFMKSELAAQNISIIESLKPLFSFDTNETVADYVKNELATDFLMELFQMYRNLTVEDTFEITPLSCAKIKLQLAYMDIISVYTFLPRFNEHIEKQKQLTYALLQFDLNPMNNIEYELMTVILNNVIKSTVGSLNHKVLTTVIDFLGKICTAKYSEYNSAYFILNIMFELYPHIAKTNNLDLQETSVNLLYPFFQFYKNYGPKVAILVTNCIGQFAKLDPECNWTCWSDNKKIVLELANFLANDYVQVRYSAIKNITSIFSENTLNFNLQRELFKEIIKMSPEVFRIECDDVSDERKIDETVTRTATVLHSFGSIIVCSSYWRPKALYALIVIVYEMKLDQALLKKLLQMVSKQIGYKSTAELLDTHFNYLINEWSANNLVMREFPHEIFECDRTVTVFIKHINAVFPLIMDEKNVELLQEVCESSGKSVDELCQEIYPSLRSLVLMVECASSNHNHNITQYDIDRSRTVKTFTSNSQSKDLDYAKIDEILINLLQSLHDTEFIKNNFDMELDLQQPDYSYIGVTDFKTALHLIETNLNEPSIILYLLTKVPNKLQHILLTLKQKIYTGKSTDEKLLSLHRYGTFIKLITPLLNSPQTTKICPYLIREITYTYVNLITSNQQPETSFELLALKYFSAYLEEILPSCSDHLHEYVSMIVNRIFSRVIDNILPCNRMCLQVLEVILVRNRVGLREALAVLDPFPDWVCFREIRELSQSLAGDLNFEESVGRFISQRDVGGGNDEVRSDGLKQLEVMLGGRKEELKGLYDRLGEMRGFTEDCNESLVHRLICCLVKYTASSNFETQRGALRCLGELGAADLTTMVLRANVRPELPGSCFEQFTGSVMDLLSQYIVDGDIEVVTAASKAMYYVLDVAESIKILDNGKLSKKYLTPFINIKSRKATKIEVDSAVYFSTANNTELWCPKIIITHSDWLIKLCTTLLKCFSSSSYIAKLSEVCKLKVSFAEQIFPMLVNLLVTNGNVKIVLSVENYIQQFFQRHWTLNVDKTVTNEIAMNKESVTCMLSVVHFLRLEKMDRSRKKSVDFSFDHLQLALASHYTRAHFSSILYAELWCYSNLKTITTASYDTFTNTTVFERIYEQLITDTNVNNLSSTSKMDISSDSNTVNNLMKVASEQRHVLELVFRETYRDLGEPDAICGFDGALVLSGGDNRVARLRDAGRWEEVLGYYDRMMSAEDGRDGVRGALKEMGLYQTSLQCCNSEPDYEAFWRLQRWNEPIATPPTTSNHNTTLFHLHSYNALKALHEDDSKTFTQAVEQARTNIAAMLNAASLECTKNVYDCLAQLQSLKELEEFGLAGGGEERGEIVRKWRLKDEMSVQFRYVEPVKEQRIIMTSIMVDKGETDLKQSLIDLHLDLAKMARTEGFLNRAKITLAKLRDIPELPSKVLGEIQFEEAQLSWIQDKRIGRIVLQDFLKRYREDPILHSLGLKLYGTWIGELRSVNTHTVISDYFLKSVKVLKNEQNDKRTIKFILEAYDVLARFADAEYQRILAYTTSTGFVMKEKGMHKLKARAKALEEEDSKIEKTSRTIFQRQSDIDEHELKNTYREKNSYLELAMNYYILNLQHCDKYNIRIFRVISLWLENKSSETLAEKSSNWFSVISTYKFLGLLPQLIPHIGNGNGLFNTEIVGILERCAMAHPHHTLPIILALCNSDKDESYCQSAKNIETDEPRSLAADKLLKKLKSRPKLKSLIGKMESLSDALIELAYIKTSKDEKSVKIDNKAKLKKLSDLEEVPVPTCTIPISLNKQYNNTAGIYAFAKDFQNVGGLNAPKKLEITGTDGKKYYTLVKGNDDMRQDAVMQQVFNIMNDLFMANKQTSKLTIRTYKVVPLSKRSGILEWVENAVPISEYLNETHKLYSKLSLTACRREYQKLASKSHSAKLSEFKNICSKLQPVFHRFFVERFHESARWYERRRAYVHSVATTSICGYVLGIGDRHVNNILIDTLTAEVVHIDFGIAFEQGHILPTPETVPFRLTREIVDGMGVTGVEGVFRRSCEQTMEVLRLNTDTIIAILEVLLYDPLYTWTITPAQAYSKQLPDTSSNISSIINEDSNGDNVNVTAERALLRLRKKLQGTEEEYPTKVEAQVLKLIDQARDPANLCRVFHGWQPYL